MGELIVESIEPYGFNISNVKKNKPMFSKIGVVGAGKDGRAIINLTASAGMEVVFMEDSQEQIDIVMNKLSKNLDYKIENWGLTQSEKRGIINRIIPTLDYETFKGCDLVIESTRYSESGRRNLLLRKNIFRKLENILEPTAIIATNSSTVIISELATDLEHKERCMSIYFPVVHPDARILELVNGMYTSEEVYSKMEIFAKLIGYIPHKVSESNGNVSLRIFTSMLNEACQILMERVTSFKNIEETFSIIYGQRFGVFRTADIVGIERIVTTMESMFNDFGDPKYKPNPLLWKLYRSQQLGVRTGKGFYIYDENGDVTGENKSLY